VNYGQNGQTEAKRRQDQSAVIVVFSCSELVGVGAEIRLITQRSLVQIQPPQPKLLLDKEVRLTLQPSEFPTLAKSKPSLLPFCGHDRGEPNNLSKDPERLLRPGRLFHTANLR
jgi:hypothetical protein